MLFHLFEELASQTFVRAWDDHDHIVRDTSSDTPDHDDQEGDHHIVESYIFFLVGHTENFRIVEVFVLTVLTDVREGEIRGDMARDLMGLDRLPKLKILHILGSLISVVRGKIFEFHGFGAVRVEDEVPEALPEGFVFSNTLREDISELVVHGDIVDEFFSEECSLGRTDSLLTDRFKGFSAVIDELYFSGRFDVGIAKVFEDGLECDRESVKQRPTRKYDSCSRTTLLSDIEGFKITIHDNIARDIHEDEHADTLDERELCLSRYAW